MTGSIDRFTAPWCEHLLVPQWLPAKDIWLSRSSYSLARWAEPARCARPGGRARAGRPGRALVAANRPTPAQRWRSCSIPALRPTAFAHAVRASSHRPTASSWMPRLLSDRLDIVVTLGPPSMSPKSSITSPKVNNCALYEAGWIASIHLLRPTG
jgi:hypothetical protein